MNPESPKDFLTWKSFQSLTQVAFIAWLIILVIDAIFIVRIEDPWKQAKLVWIIGLGICTVLSDIRVYYKEPRERGDWVFVLVNAFLIFLYASGYTGASKELATWSNLPPKTDSSKAQLYNLSSASPFYEASIGALSLFANQTSIWPDVKIILENENLKEEKKELVTNNQMLQQRLKNRQDSTSLGTILDLNRQILALQEDNHKLFVEAEDCKQKLLACQTEKINGIDSKLKNQSLDAKNRTLDKYVTALLQRIEASNKVVSSLQKIRSESCILKYEDRAFSIFNECSDYRNSKSDYLSVIKQIEPVDVAIPK